MRAAYRVLASLLALGVVVQIGAIALAGFTTSHDADDGVAIGADYRNAGLDIHGMGAMVIALLAVLLLVVSFFTDVERGRALAAGALGAVALQFALAIAGAGVPLIGVLHAVNGLGLMAMAGAAARRAATPAAATTGAGATVGG